MPDNTEPVVPPDLGTALLRTVTPYVVTFVIAKLTELGIDSSSFDVNGAVVMIGGSLYYGVARFLEQKWPNAGWLLGKPAKPTYDAPPTPPKDDT